MSTDPTQGITPTPAESDRRISPSPVESVPASLPDEDVAPVPQDERTLAVLCHVGGFFTWIILPLILWTSNKEKSPFVDEHGKEALNFQIAVTIYYFVGCLLLVVWIPVMIYELIVVILAAMAANRGELYRIPFNIRFIK